MNLIQTNFFMIIKPLRKAHDMDKTKKELQQQSQKVILVQYVVISTQMLMQLTNIIKNILKLQRHVKVLKEDMKLQLKTPIQIPEKQ